MRTASLVRDEGARDLYATELAGEILASLDCFFCDMDDKDYLLAQERIKGIIVREYVERRERR